MLFRSLADGPVEVTTLQKEAKAAGLSWMTVRRAKESLPIAASKEGYSPGKWQWKLEGAHVEGAHSSDRWVSAFEQGTENKAVNTAPVIEDAHISITKSAFEGKAKSAFEGKAKGATAKKPHSPDGPLQEGEIEI